MVPCMYLVNILCILIDIFAYEVATAAARAAAEVGGPFRINGSLCFHQTLQLKLESLV